MKQTSRLLIAGLALMGLAYLSVCLLLYFSQRSYIYYPADRNSDVPSFTLHREDADIVVSTNNLRSNRAVLYFGGNAEDVSRSIALLSRSFPGAAIYAMHYRSYGGSTGDPAERDLVADGTALLKLVERTHPGVSVVGRSLGSGVAVQVAAAGTIERLVLVTPYNSIAELAAERFKLFPTGLILRDKYESWRHAGNLQAPTTIIIAANDQIIPYESSMRLAKAFPEGSVNLVVIPNADHDNVSASPEYLAAIGGQTDAPR